MKFPLVVCPIILSLAACGGSSTGGDAAFTTTQGALDELEFFIDKSDRLDVTPFGNVPVTGSASYEGVFGVARFVERFPGDTNPNVEDPLIGEVTLDVDFQANTLSGSADNFFDGVSSVSGNLAIFDGELFRDNSEGVVFGADVDGRLPIAGAQRDIEGILIGGFNGNQAQLIESVFIGVADDEYSVLGSVVADN